MTRLARLSDKDLTPLWLALGEAAVDARLAGVPLEKDPDVRRLLAEVDRLRERLEEGTA